MKIHRLLPVLLAGLLAAPAVAAGCGGSVACAVAGGEYRIEVPPAGEASGVVLFFHGYRGSAEGQMRARGLKGAAFARGLAFAAPDGAGGSWSHPGSPSERRDETAFVGAVLDDLQARFGFAGDRVFASGFSQGASMVFSALCDHPDRFAGAITFAGVFWEPLPSAPDCAGAPPIVHVHGRDDVIFPLVGRPIGERFRQGDTFRSLAILKEGAGCVAEAPAPVVEGMDCRVASGCARGPVALCLHDGGHEVRGEWLGLALGWLGH